MARHAAAVALLLCGVLPQCAAAKLHKHRTNGVYLTHDNKVIQSLARHTPGVYWIDGYRMAISNQTQICWHDAVLQFSPILNRDGQSIPGFKATSPCESALSGALMGSAWLQYLVVQKYLSDYRLNSEMNVAASRVDVWRSANRGDQTQAGPKLTWRSLCASTSPHELRYQNEGPINVVCDAGVNNYVENVFLSLLKSSATTLDTPIEKQGAPPGFYVVKPFEVRHNYDFEAIDGSAAICGLPDTPCRYQPLLLI